MTNAEPYDEWTKIRKSLIKIPGAMIKIGKTEYPTKVFWRAAAGRYGLSVALANEECLGHGTNDECWVVNYTASHPSGSSQNGDGACSHSEKRSYEKNPNGSTKFLDGKPVQDDWVTLKNATSHNIRAHAHTRAYNRSVSNLIGHGELSAEEIQRSAPAPSDPEPDAPKEPAKETPPPPKEEKKVRFSKKSKPAPDPKVNEVVEKVEAILTEGGLDPEWWEDATYFASNQAYKGKLNFSLQDIRDGKFSRNQVLPMYGVLKRVLPELLTMAEEQTVASGTRFQEVPF